MQLEGSTIDLAVHGITMIAAAILFVVALRAYRTRRSRKFRYVCAAFGLFAVKELLLTANIFWLGIPVLQAVAHLLNLVILTAFFAGVVR